PPFKEATLGSGLQLVLVEHHEQPVVSVSLSFRAGETYDPPGKEGLAELVAELLSKGTASRSAEQIAATIEGVGGSLSASASEDVTRFAADRLRPAGALLVVAGDVTERQVDALVEQVFAGWRGSPPTARPPPPPPATAATDILLVHRPGSSQANIVLGNTTI